MKFKFNPFTGTFDVVNDPLTKPQVIKAILLDSAEDIMFPVASILFDDDSILFDGEECND